MKIIDKIRYAYWKIIPYNWRPGQIWYKIKCFLWLRYTTIKPRWLDHTYVDSDILIEYSLMEILCRFVEEDMDGVVNWYYETEEYKGNKTQFQGNERWVRDVFLEIYEWWTKDYLINIEKCHDEWFEYVEKNNITAFDFILDATKGNEEQKKHADKLWKEAQAKEESYRTKLTEYLITLVNLRGYMWT